jgi:hypothetical protein
VLGSITHPLVRLGLPLLLLCRAGMFSRYHLVLLGTVSVCSTGPPELRHSQPLVSTYLD